MSTSPLLELAVELQEAVFDYIYSYADLKSLCLVCRETYHLAHPKLYRSIVVSASGLIKAVPRSLHSENAGLKHTRNLKVYHPKNGKKVPNRKLDAALRLFSSWIPPDSLLKVHLDGDQSVRLATKKVLWARHKTLREIYVGVPQRFGQYLPPGRLLQNLRSLSLDLPRDYPGEESENDVAPRLLRETKNLEELDICVLGGFGAARSMSLRRLLSSCATDSPLQLKNVTFANVVLDRDLAESLSNATSLSFLHSLKLLDCANSETFLGALIGTTPSLTSLIVECDGSEDDTASWQLRAEFTKSIIALRNLRLTRIRDDIYLAILNNINPGQLRAIYVPANFSYKPWTDAEFSHLCITHPTHQQLAIPSPDLPIPTEAPNEVKFANLDGLFQSLTNVRSPTSLRLFVRSAEPEDDYDENPETVTTDTRTAIGAWMRRLAGYAFDQLRQACPRFRAIAIDPSLLGPVMMSGRRDLKRPFAFLRGLNNGELGDPRVAYPVELDMIQKYVPGSDIFYD
jgi:hypothetical protein